MADLICFLQDNNKNLTFKPNPMKSFFLKALPGCVFAILLFSNKTKGQYMVNGKEVDTAFNTSMNHIFGNLDNTRIPFGLLRDYAMEFTNLENYNGVAISDSTMLNRSLFYEIYNTLATARLTSAAYSSVPNPDVIDSTWFASNQAGQVTLCGLFFQYGYLNSNAVNNGTITVTNNQLFDKYVNGVYQNPYLQDRTAGFAPFSDTYRGQSFNINLPANLWLTNSASMVNHIEIDAGDGLGYRTITPGTNLGVSYADTGFKVLNFKLYLTDNSVLQSNSRLHVIPDPLAVYGGGPYEGSVTTIHGVTPSNIVNVYRVVSTAQYQGTSGLGLITIHYAQNHTSLIKPLIVVEGFDAGIYLDPTSTTGTNSISDFYADVDNSHSLNFIGLLEGSTSQYDVIYVDFTNGTDDIHRNALVVEDVIRWVNSQKTGGNQNVVLGLSMGTLISRYALKKMELAGENHDTWLYISHGGPQQGANAPVGYQYLENHAGNLYARSGPTPGKYEFLRLFVRSLPNVGGILKLTDAPAAQQMLINRIDNNFNLNNTTHTAWQQELLSLGYPVNCRNIAISNGSQCAKPQDLQIGGQLLYIDGKLKSSLATDVVLSTLTFTPNPFSTRGLAALLGVIPGRNDIRLHFETYGAADGGGNMVYKGTMALNKTILGIIPVTVTLTNRSFNAPSGIYPLESFEGDEYVIHHPIQSTSVNKLFIKYNITANQFPEFDFIPTTSALDIGKGSVVLAESDYQLPYAGSSPPAAPKNTPFANFITAYYKGPNNEEHLSYDQRSGDWLVNELKATPAISGCAALCQINVITGDAYDCNGVKSYSVPNYAGVHYTWSYSSNLQLISGQNTNAVQIQPVTGTNGQPATLTVKINDATGDCGPLTIIKTITIGIEPLVVNSTVDRTPQQSNYQYLTATATQLANTTSSNYTWWLTDSNGQVQYQIGSGLQLTNYPIAPCSTIYYQCQAVTACGTAIYNGYAYNTTCGGGGYASVNQSVVIYPNPANSSMTVTNNSIPATMDASGNPNGNVPQSYRILVYNDKGQILKSAQNANGNASINIGTADLANGNYFLHIMQGKNVIEKQIVVQH
jgi:hypothetical protein